MFNEFIGKKHKIVGENVGENVCNNTSSMAYHYKIFYIYILIVFLVIIFFSEVFYVYQIE